MLNLSRKPHKKRSPLRQRSLPQAGDGLQSEIQARFFDVAMWITVPILFLTIALIEWGRYWLKSPPTPWFYTIVLIVSAIFCGRKIWRIWHSIDPLALGLRGERTVGQLLETLRARGYHVFHDLQQDGYNIDHVIVGPAGVFAIETKTRCKRENGNPKVVYDGQRILIDGHESDRNPIAQVKASADRVRQILEEQTAQDVAVKGVVLYPGWWVETTARNAEVDVSNETYFIKTFEHRDRQRILTEGQIKVLAAGIERSIRSVLDSFPQLPI